MEMTKEKAEEKAKAKVKAVGKKEARARDVRSPKAQAARVNGITRQKGAGSEINVSSRTLENVDAMVLRATGRGVVHPNHSHMASVGVCFCKLLNVRGKQRTCYRL